MSKRFTETDKWKDAWFRKLQPYEKLLFLYILDNCDNAGFLELDRFLASYQIGITEDEVQGAYKGLERAIEGASDGSDWVWVRNFLKHQKNEELNEKNPAHRQIISLIKAQNGRGFEGASKALVSPYGIGIGNGIKEESVRGDDSDEFKRVVKEMNELLGTHYKSSSKAEWAGFIRARLGDGYTPDQLLDVIKAKKRDPHFIQNPHYLNPVTLFRPTNFEKYVNSPNLNRANLLEIPRPEGIQLLIKYEGEAGINGELSYDGQMKQLQAYYDRGGFEYALAD